MMEFKLKPEHLQPYVKPKNVKTYTVILKEVTEHVVEVFAENKTRAREEAVDGWKQGMVVADNPELLRLTATNCYEKFPQ